MEFVVVGDCFLPPGTVVECDDERFDADLQRRLVRVCAHDAAAPALVRPIWVPLAAVAWLPDGPDRWLSLATFWSMRTGRGVSSAGDPAAPAILFVHAGSLTRHQSPPAAGVFFFSGAPTRREPRRRYRPQVLALGALGFHAIAVDMAGHGDYAGQEVFTLARSVDRCVLQLGRLGVRRALVVGTSLGGNVAGLLAARFPKLAAGLFVHGCTTDFSSPEIRKKFDLDKIFVCRAAFFSGLCRRPTPSYF